MNNFDQEILRLEATNEYHKAFLLCLQNMKNPDLQQKAKDKAHSLIENRFYNVMERYSKGYRITVDKQFDNNWLLDVAIELGYKDIKKSTMSVGFFDSVPNIVLGLLWAKHKLALRRNKDNTTTIYYKFTFWCDDFKMIKAVCDKIVEMY